MRASSGGAGNHENVNYIEKCQLNVKSTKKEINFSVDLLLVHP